MPTKFPCPHCKTAFEMPDDTPGVLHPCPACGAKLTILVIPPASAYPTAMLADQHSDGDRDFDRTTTHRNSKPLDWPQFLSYVALGATLGLIVCFLLIPYNTAAFALPTTVIVTFMALYLNKHHENTASVVTGGLAGLLFIGYLVYVISVQSQEAKERLQYQQDIKRIRER